MAKPEWDKFEWDDENKKGGNVSTCAIMTSNLRKLRNVSSMTTFLPGTVDVLTTFMFLMERLIEEDNCDWFSRTKAVDSREYSPAGN